MIFAERIYTILEIGTDLFPVFFYGNFSKKKKHLLFSGLPVLNLQNKDSNIVFQIVCRSLQNGVEKGIGSPFSI